KQIDLFAEIIALLGAHSPRPGNVRADHRALLLIEQARVPLRGQDGEDRLFMDQLRAKTVDHADGASTISLQQRGIQLDDRLVLVNEQPLVNDVNFEFTDAQTIALKLQLVRRANDRRVTFTLEELLEQLKLFLRR